MQKSTISNNFYGDFDFQLLNSSEFKEDAVREELINPILKNLGYKSYGHNRIVYSKTLSHPFVKIGSQKRQINIVPDYLFEINGKYSWVLEAKSPDENILSGDNIEQIFSYAIHPDIQADIFALCNGKEFIAFSKDKKEPLLFFQLSEIDKHWIEIEKILSPDSFVEKKILRQTVSDYEPKQVFSYGDLKLPKPIIPKKQAAKRHFGVTAYFTRQSWDILQHYIKHFTKQGDTVLDPFAGSGVTMIESLMLGRKAITLDINPLSIFIIQANIADIDFDLFEKEFNRIKSSYSKNVSTTIKYPYPKTPILMKDADVETVDKLFNEKQLAELGLLKSLIIETKNKNVRNSFLLAFYNTLSKINLTFHSTPKGGGNHFGFYYRYRLAKTPAFLNTFDVFSEKVKRVISSKKEIKPFINNQTLKNAQILKGTATDLSQIETESIDYIYTDPPYGSKIPYLDLSVMWNAWLDLDVTDEDRKKEIIEGGSLQKTKDEYSDLLAQSIKEMYRVLKFDRWMSFVFAHKDPHYWHIIIDTAEKCGFEYAGSVKQDNGQTSFKKRQNPFSVLSGQLIINFIKKNTPKAIQKFKLGSNIYDLIIETIEAEIAKNNGATLEQINDELIIKGLEFGFLDILSREYKDLTPILINEFDYDKQNKKFLIRQNQKFKTKIPLDMRIKYFLISYLKRKESEGINPTTDDIILDIMPLLRNGKTPEDQTILKVLRMIADEIGANEWKIKQTGQLSLDARPLTNL